MIPMILKGRALTVDKERRAEMAMLNFMLNAVRTTLIVVVGSKCAVKAVDRNGPAGVQVKGIQAMYRRNESLQTIDK